MHITRTHSANKDFQLLVTRLDAYLSGINGEEDSFYRQYNKTDHIQHVVVLYENELPVGCGAFKAFDNDSVEIKRMFVEPAYRGRGYATQILQELETWAAELAHKYTVLETGSTMTDALGLYQNRGYTIIENYGPYAGKENSVCMRKELAG